MKLPHKFLDHPSTSRLLTAALREDLGHGDLTSRLVVPASLRAYAHVAAHQPGVAAGLLLVQNVYRRLDPRVRVELCAWDGEAIERGQILALLKGPARALLVGERVALNLLQHLSGIATLTAAFVAKVKGTRCQLLDTRKTLPGLRLLEKYAVACGGGVNHRLRLDDAILIKDNHLQAIGSLAEAVRRAKRARKPVQVEVDTLDQLDEALASGANAVLLDNMPLPTLRRAVAHVRAFTRAKRRRVVTEASGGVTLKTVRAIARTGVDRVSVGALTHSAPALDIGMDFQW